MKTLQRYIFKDLTKTFILALLGVTALLVLAGGVFNVMTRAGVPASALFSIIIWLIPVVFTLTMPLMAIFAATMVYGRLASDNELTACRAAGINIFRLLTPAIILSIFVTVFLLFFVNYVSPSLRGQIETKLKGSMVSIAEQYLKTTGFISLRPDKLLNESGEKKDDAKFYFLSADGVYSQFDEQELIDNDWNPELKYLQLDGPTVLELNENFEVQRLFTAQMGWCEFDIRKSPAEVTFYLVNSIIYSKQKVATWDKNQTTRAMPDRVSLQKVSFESLDKLMEYQQSPWKAPKLANSLQNFYKDLAKHYFIQHCFEGIEKGEGLQLRDEVGLVYEIYADSCEMIGKREMRCVNPRILVQNAPLDSAALLVGAEATISPEKNSTLSFSIKLDGRDPNWVSLSNPDPQSTYSRRRTEESYRVTGLLVPESVEAAVKAATPERVFGGIETFELHGTSMGSVALTEELEELRADAGELQRQIAAIYHYRFGFTAITPVLIVLGAALGIMFRGSHALAAFGLAFIPFGIVIVLMLMGRSVGEKPGTELVGAIIIWGGLAAIAAANTVILRVGVKR